MSELNNENPLDLIGARGIKENFFVFFVFGISIVLFGGVAFDLTKDLPDKFVKIIQESFAINTFVILTCIGLVISALTGSLAGEKAIHHRFISKWVLAFSRVGLSAGAIVSGMLLGIGVALWLITLGAKNGQLAAEAIRFIGLSFFFVLILLPLIIVHLYLLFPWSKRILWLDLLSFAYFLAIIPAFFLLENYIDWYSLGLQGATLVTFGFVMKKLEERKN